MNRCCNSVSRLLAQVLSTPRSRDVTESPIVRAVILSDPANAAEIVPALEHSQELEAYNARCVLCLFEANAVPHLLAKLRTAGPNARKEGLEILWSLLFAEEAWTVREILCTVKSDLDTLLGDTHPLPDDMPDYIERDFRGRICDLAYIVIQLLLSPQFDESTFRSMENMSRDREIDVLKRRDFSLTVA